MGSMVQTADLCGVIVVRLPLRSKNTRLGYNNRIIHCSMLHCTLVLKNLTSVIMAVEHYRLCMSLIMMGGWETLSRNYIFRS